MNIVKKIGALLLTLMMACVAISAMALTAEEVQGDWYLTEMTGTNDGETFSINPAAMGIQIQLTLNEDGTAVMKNLSDETDEDQVGTWEIKDDAVVLTENDEAMTLILEDGILKGEMDGSGFVFSREMGEAVAAPEVISAESEDVFLGSWKVSLINMDGTLFPVDTINQMGLEFSSTLTITPGEAAFNLTFMMELPEITGTTVFEDGKLVFTAGGLGTPLSIQATDSGAIFMEFDLADMELNLPLYFEKAE